MSVIPKGRIRIYIGDKYYFDIRLQVNVYYLDILSEFYKILISNRDVKIFSEGEQIKRQWPQQICSQMNNKI